MLKLLLVSLLLYGCGTGKQSDVVFDNSIAAKTITLSSPQDILFKNHDGKLYISWSDVQGASSYKAYISTLENFDPDTTDADKLIIVDSIETAEVTLDNLTINTPYFIIIAALNTNNEEVRSTQFRIVLTAKTIEFTLNPPQDFKANPGEGQIQLEWQELPEALNYVLYYSDFDGSVDPTTANQIIEIASPPFTHQSLKANTAYHYRIGAVTPLGLTPLSQVVSATPEPYTTAPDTPGSFTAIASDALVALQWEAVSTASSYTLYMAREPDVNANNYTSLDGGQRFTEIDNISANRLDLENNTTYYFSIAAVNNVGESPASIAIAATPKSANPSVPSKVKARSLENAIQISWEAVADANSYTLYWSNNINFNQGSATGVEQTTGTSFTHKDLTESKLYYYFVTAHNESGESESSALVSATP
ncbi:MAG: hypothetical protein R3240_13900, partial [Gammaproteobacteria bacterium]|nr:hypothetical protein [Gammaproteobacteria bacterium]